jgi:AraC-like DNA-binding protein
MPASHSIDFAAPLVAALSKVVATLERESEARIVVATRYESELRQQKLPAHIKTTSRPLRGKRVPMRGVKNFRVSRLKVATWPEDNVDESALACLLLVISGQADLVVGDYIMHTRPGDIVLLPAGVPKGNYLSNVLDGDAQRTCQVFWIYPGRLLGDGLECWVSFSQGDKLEVNLEHGAALIRNHQLAQHFEQLCDEMESHSEKNILYYLLLSFLLLLHRELGSGRSFMPYARRLHLPVEPSSDFGTFVKSYIDSNLDSHLTVEVMAKQMVMSPTSFKQRFREAMGTTFHEYLTNARADFGATLLLNTDLKVDAVAEKVGLKYPQFRKLFLTKFGTTPGTYRKSRNTVGK